MADISGEKQARCIRPVRVQNAKPARFMRTITRVNRVCAQTDVLKKIRKKGKVNGYDIDLAEAQMKDYVSMKRRVETIESDVSSIKNTLVEHGTKLDLIIARLNSPVEAEREAGQKWNLLVSISKHKVVWVILALCAISFALAGEKLASIIEKLI